MAVIAGALVCAFAPAAGAQTGRLEPLPQIVARAAENSPTDGVMRRGTGFAVSPFEVVTAGHVVAGCRKLSVRTSFGQDWAATLILLDARLDTALLRLPTPLGASLAVDNAPPSDSVLLYDRAGPTRSFVQGRLDGVENAAGVRLTRLQPGLAEGASGGPVIDGRGVVVGVSVGRADQRGDAISYTLALDGRRLLQFLDYAGADYRRPQGGPLPFVGSAVMNANDVGRARDAIVVVQCT